MVNNEVAEMLNKIASGLDKIAEDLEKEASETKEEPTKKDFSFGKLGSTPNSNADPLTSFIFS